MAEKKPIWDNCEYVGEVIKSEGTKLKIELVARDGVKYVNIREWYMKKSTNTWMPGMSGFAIPIMMPIAGAVQKPIDKLVALVLLAIDASDNFAIEGNKVYAVDKPKKK